MNAVVTYDYDEAIAEFRVDLRADEWGHTMGWLFPIAEEIHFNRDFEVPADWQYRPSPLGYSGDEDDYITSILQGMSDTALLLFGRVLHRYEERLRRHDMNY